MMYQIERLYTQEISEELCRQLFIKEEKADLQSNIFTLERKYGDGNDKQRGLPGVNGSFLASSLSGSNVNMANLGPLEGKDCVGELYH